MKLHDAASRRTLQMYRTVNCEISSFPTCMSHLFSSFSDLFSLCIHVVSLSLYVYVCVSVRALVRLQSGDWPRLRGHFLDSKKSGQHQQAAFHSLITGGSSTLLSPRLGRNDNNAATHSLTH